MSWVTCQFSDNGERLQGLSNPISLDRLKDVHDLLLLRLEDAHGQV